MDAEWQHGVHALHLLATIRQINPNNVLQDVLRRASEGCEVPAFVRFSTDEWTNCKPALSSDERVDEIRWLQRGGEVKAWSQHGSQSHWDRMASLVEHVQLHACMGKLPAS